MAISDFDNLLLNEQFRRSDACIDLTRVIQRGYSRTIQLENHPSWLLPARDGLVDLRINRDGFGTFSLQIEDTAKLRQPLDRNNGIIGYADPPINLQRHAGELRGVRVPALFDENIRQPHDIARGGG